MIIVHLFLCSILPNTQSTLACRQCLCVSAGLSWDAAQHRPAEESCTPLLINCAGVTGILRSQISIKWFTLILWNIYRRHVCCSSSDRLEYFTLKHFYHYFLNPCHFTTIHLNWDYEPTEMQASPGYWLSKSRIEILNKNTGEDPVFMVQAFPGLV